MSDTEAQDEIITSSYTIKRWHKARIEALAKDNEISNASVIMRRILDDYFARLDAPSPKSTRKLAKAQ